MNICRNDFEFAEVKILTSLNVANKENIVKIKAINSTEEYYYHHQQQSQRHLLTISSWFSWLFHSDTTHLRTNDNNKQNVVDAEEEFAIGYTCGLWMMFHFLSGSLL
jgi:hypothetical protein